MISRSCRRNDSLFSVTFLPPASRQYSSNVTPPPSNDASSKTSKKIDLLSLTSSKLNHVDVSSQKVVVEMEHGLPHVTVPLPSRNEPCIFALRPVTHNVGDFLNMLRLEDPGIDRAVIRTVEGVRIASTTSIQVKT